MASEPPATVGVIGLGLIGGSVGLALRDPARRVVGYDRDPAAARIARDRMCVDALASLEEVAQAELVFVAVPPDATVETVAATMAAAAPATVVTDCASVKTEVARWAKETVADRFVPGHPMAGHEKGGAAYASAWMFRGARWVLTPVAATKAAAVRTVEAAAKAMGATPVRVEAEAHDRHVATVSHLPHALAAVLVNLGASLGSADVAGGSWRDMTRVGGVDPDLWTQIFLSNRTELAATLRTCETELAGLRAALEADDREAVRAVLQQAERAKAGRSPEETARTLKKGRR